MNVKAGIVFDLDERGQWSVGLSPGVFCSVGQPRVEAGVGGLSRLIVDMPEAIGVALASRPEAFLPRYPAPLEVTAQLAHAVRELAGAAVEMTAAARALKEKA